MLLLRGHTANIRRVSYSPDGSLLASCGEDNSVRLWDPISGAMRSRFVEVLKVGLRIVYDLAFSPDGSLLATTHPETGVRIWRVADGGAALRRLSTPGDDRKASGVIWGMSIRPDGQELLAVGRRRQIFGLSMPSCTIAWRQGIEPTGMIWCIASSRVDRGFAVGLDAVPSSVLVFARPRTRTFERLNVPTRVRAVEFSPDGRHLVAASGPSAYLWDLSSRRSGPAGASMPAVLAGHSATIRGLAFSPDGSTLATASHDGTVRLWDVAEAVERARFDWGIGKTDCVAFSPDGMTLAAGGERDLIIWDADARA